MHPKTLSFMPEVISKFNLSCLNCFQDRLSLVDFFFKFSFSGNCSKAAIFKVENVPNMRLSSDRHIYIVIYTGLFTWKYYYLTVSVLLIPAMLFPFTIIKLNKYVSFHSMKYYSLLFICKIIFHMFIYYIW